MFKYSIIKIKHGWRITMFKRQMQILLFTLIGVFTYFSFSITGLAKEENNLFKVTIVPNDLQKNQEDSFFDLLVEPNDQTKLSLLITNTGKEKKKIIISPTNATTNKNGEVDYSELNAADSRDSSLKVALTDLIDEKKEVDLKAGETQKVDFNLKIPKEEFDGVILGAFVVYVDETGISSQPGKKNTGMTIQNKFEIRKVIQIQQTNKIIIPDLKLNDVGFNWVDNTPALTANIQNLSPTLFGGISIKATVREKNNSKLIKEYSATDIEMAPNSNFNFPIFWYNQEIREGNYSLLLNISSGSQTWDLDKVFQISKKDSTKYNELYRETSNNKLTWVDFLIIGLIILVFLILIAITAFILKDKKNVTILKETINNLLSRKKHKSKKRK